MRLRYLLVLMFTAASLSAASLIAQDPYVRATPPGVPNSAAFMALMNHSDKDVAVVSASSPAASKVELHTHEIVNGEMHMYQVKQIEVKAHSQTMLQPGGFHIMFLGLKSPLAEGNSVELTLTLSNGETVSIKAAVKKVMAGMQMHMQHGQHEHH